MNMKRTRSLQEISRMGRWVFLLATSTGPEGDTCVNDGGREVECKKWPDLVLTRFKKNAIVAISGLAKLVDQRKIVLLNDRYEQKSWRRRRGNITWSNLLSLTE